ncbi:MAG: hypothetical protein PVS3B3_06690 [Ktedonobacteraceae bacterium]
MQKTRTWRDLLKELIRDTQVRQRVITELEINPITLNRWIQGESRPRPRSLRRLLLVLPEHRESLLALIEEEFDDFAAETRDDVVQNVPLTIPAEFYKRVLHTLVAIPTILRFSSLCDLILQQAIEQLDPYGQGVAVIVASCMPPSSFDKIRSLRERAGRGTTPWPRDLEQYAILLGVESLAGHAVSTGHLEVNQALGKRLSLSLGYKSVWEESAAAVPIMREGKIAGSLLVSSAQLNYFSPERCTLIESYAELVALAFGLQDFYEAQQIELGFLPSYDIQQPYLSSFRQRVVQTLKEAINNKRLVNIVQAEQMVWQQIEEKFLQEDVDTDAYL